MPLEALRDSARSALESLRAQDVVCLDVSTRSGFADWFVIATATSARHAKALAERLRETLEADGVEVLGVEGRSEAEWILVDCGALVAHIMQAGAREFYDLERLWGDSAAFAPDARHHSG